MSDQTYICIIKDSQDNYHVRSVKNPNKYLETLQANTSSLLTLEHCVQIRKRNLSLVKNSLKKMLDKYSIKGRTLWFKLSDDMPSKIVKKIISIDNKTKKSLYECMSFIVNSSNPVEPTTFDFDKEFQKYLMTI